MVELHEWLYKLSYFIGVVSSMHTRSIQFARSNPILLKDLVLVNAYNWAVSYNNRILRVFVQQKFIK